ncbi:MAG: hypothetical protein AAGI48_14215 [Verrucomicrobiota bacterium]
MIGDEAFATEAGKVVGVWNLRFSNSKRISEAKPCWRQQEDGSSIEGQLKYVIEVSKVEFQTSPDAVLVGEKGQLSTDQDGFCKVEITAVEIGDGCDLVLGEARKVVDWET